MLSTWALLMVAVVTEIAWGCSLKALSYFSLSRFFALIPIALTCANMYLLALVMRLCLQDSHMPFGQRLVLLVYS